MKETEAEETETKVLFAPTQFYDACDDCDTLPEDRWDEFRQKRDDEKKIIVEGRERVGHRLRSVRLRVCLSARRLIWSNEVPVVFSLSATSWPIVQPRMKQKPLTAKRCRCRSPRPSRTVIEPKHLLVESDVYFENRQISYLDGRFQYSST